MLYPSGWGNLGDEAILQATFAALRKQWPDAVLRAFTLHPANTFANHGIEAEPLTGINRHLFGAPLGEGPVAVRAARGVARRLESVPVLGGLAARLAGLLGTLVFEAESIDRAWRWLRTADLVLASGGGQLDAVWGGTWGQPYALARWSWLARRTRVPFALLSVGYGGASGWLSRRFIRYAVRNAVYCSVRDSGSRALTLELGVERDLPVVPDIAFGLRKVSPFPPRRPGHDIGISPMVYLRPGSWPRENQSEYFRLVQLWADVVAETVRNGDRVHMFVSSPSDMAAVRDVWALLDEGARAACRVAHTENPDALLAFYSGLDVVISSRLHGVLLAIVAGRPVLALSHERKVRAVMNDAGVPEFCADLTSATAAEVLGMLRGLTDRLEECANRLGDYAETANAALTRQDELISQLLKRRA